MDLLSADLQEMALEHASPSLSSTLDAFAKFTDYNSNDTQPFYDLEGQVLSLWDLLLSKKLELALLEAQYTSSADLPADDLNLDSKLVESERECLEARLAYTSRNSAIRGVLSVEPILKAVHSELDATPTERTLSILTSRRDGLALVYTNLFSSLQSLEQVKTQIEAANISMIRKNHQLASTVMKLANEAKTKKDNVREMERFRDKLTEAQEQVTTAQERWRIMKGVAAAVVAGSGINWSRDEELRGLVSDAGDEDI